IAGRYEIKLTRPYGSGMARAAGRVSSYALPVDGEPGALVKLDLALRGESGGIVVRVSSGAGPVGNALVHVGPLGDSPVKLPDGRAAVQRTQAAYSDDHGAATLTGILPGQPTLTVRMKGFEETTRAVDVAPGKTAEIDVRLVRLLPIADRV